VISFKEPALGSTLEFWEANRFTGTKKTILRPVNVNSSVELDTPTNEESKKRETGPHY
jgi:hypothetical protein